MPESIVFIKNSFDSHAAYDKATDTYTIVRDGVYQIGNNQVTLKAGAQLKAPTSVVSKELVDSLAEVKRKHDAALGIK